MNQKINGEQRHETFGDQVSGTLVMNLALAGSGLVTGVIAARLLGPVGRGELNAIQTWPTFIASIALLGMGEALIYYTAKDESHTGSWFASSVSLAFISSLGFAFAGWVIMPWLLAAQPKIVISTARIYVIGICLLYATVSMLQHPLRGRKQTLAWNVVRGLPTLGWLLVILMAFLIDLASPAYLAFGYLIMFAIMSIPSWLVFRRFIRGPYHSNPAFLSPLVRYGLPVILGTLVVSLNLRLDQMLMASMVAPQVLGLYVVAATWSGLTIPILSSISMVLFQRIASSDSYIEATSQLAQGVRITTLLGILLACILILVTPFVLPWVFGAAFVGSVGISLILVLASVVLGIILSLEESCRGLGKPQLIYYAEASGLLVTLPLLLFLIPLYKAWGAAISSLAGYSVVLVALIWMVCRDTGILASQLLIPRPNDLMRVLYAVVRLVRIYTSSV